MHRLIYLALVVYGAFAQITQALLIREDLVVFYGNEVSLGAFFGSWLLWIAVGSALAIPLKHRVADPLPWVRGLLLASPLLLALQIGVTRFVRHLLDVSSTQFIPLGELFASVTLINLPTALALGIAFPLACQALQQHATVLDRDSDRRAVRGIAHLYIFDALGALVGGFVFTFVLVEWAGVWTSWGIVLLAMAATAWLLGRLPTAGPAWVKRGLGYASGLWLVATALFLLTPLNRSVDHWLEAGRFATLQPGLELVEAIETRYGHVAVASLGAQTSLVSDGQISASFPDPDAVQEQAAYAWAQARFPRRILLFGGLAGGLPAELLRYPVEQVTVIEQDRRAYDMVLPHLDATMRTALDDPRLRVHFEDGRRFANRPHDEDYDLVLVFAADPASAHENRYFTADFYARLHELMTPTGVVCTQVSSASNYLGRTVRSYTGSVYRTLHSQFAEIAIMPGDRHTYCAARQAGMVSEDPYVLEARYQLAPLEEHRFPAASFHSLLPAERIAFVRQQFADESGGLNTDARPVTYYYNMVLWGKFSSSRLVEWLEKLRRMGAWPYLLPLLVLVVLTLLRFSLQPLDRPRFQRQSATLVLAVLGLVAMAAQLALLYSYQAHVGFVFSRIALLNSLFMAGLALGAGLIGRRLATLTRPDRALLGVMLATTALLLLLPQAYRGLDGLLVETQEPVYLALTLVIGLLTGTGFPLGVQLAQADTGNVLHTSGIAAWADNLGGAVGGFVTGALLVPILGVGMTCYTLALMAYLSLMPLAFTASPWIGRPLLRARGYRAFPWPTLSWSVAWLVVTALAIKLILPTELREPTTRFDPIRLATVSQSAEFTFDERPWPHYRGGDANSERIDTVSLATLAVVDDVQGYAGPINLLFALDRDGVLRGVDYVDSVETPSYIMDIKAWVESLRGVSLAEQPLTLDRIDGLSGATVTSRAAFETLNRAADAASRAVFDRPLYTTGQPGIDWLQPKVLVLIAVLGLFFPVYFSGRDRWRLAYQGLVLVVLGFWFNALVTEVDLVNLTEGRMPAPASSLLHFLLISFTLLLTLLFGQVYCGYICPFGALQEFLSRAGRYFYLRSYPTQPLERRMRYLKYLLLAAMLGAYWLTGDMFWVHFNPMQHLFALQLDDWMLVITVISLLGALVYYRFWCRYFCPFGAFLALGNKLALFRRHSPERVFKHCDLGVDDEFDVDCIRCHRCIEGRDYGLRKRPPD